MIITAAELSSRIARPARESRWTVHVLDPADSGHALAAAGRFAAEDATVVLHDGPAAAGGLIVLDSWGAVQHVGLGVEDALSAIAAFRVGDRRVVGRSI